MGAQDDVFNAAASVPRKTDIVLAHSSIASGSVVGNCRALLGAASLLGRDECVALMAARRDRSTAGAHDVALCCVASSGALSGGREGGVGAPRRAFSPGTAYNARHVL